MGDLTVFKHLQNLTMIEISNPKEYQKFIKSCPVVLVHFWAKWNGYDAQIKNTLKGIESSYLGKACFGTVDVDIEEMVSICQELKLGNVPTLAYYKGGRHIETIIETIVGLNQRVEEKLTFLI